MNTWLAVFIGGGLGSLARYMVSLLSFKFLTYHFPWGTFLSNVMACLVLAIFLLTFRERLDDQPFWRFLIITGFCGGFSTFSTFSLETYELIRTQHLGLALANVLVSLAVGLFIMFVLLKDVHFPK